MDICILHTTHSQEGENSALLNDLSVVFKVSNTVKTDHFPLCKPGLGAITMSLDIMISQKPVVTRNLLLSNDRQYLL